MKQIGKQNEYTAPELEVLGLVVEGGYASSFDPSVEEGNAEDAWS